MKKALALILALVMMFTLAACATEEPEETTEATTTEATTTEATTTEATTTEATTTEATTTEAPVAGTAGEMMKSEFVNLVNSGTTEPYAIAEALAANENIQFMAGATEVAPDTWLAGFSAETISGFKSGAMFGPMMGSIPFIGYIFELEEGADVDAFIDTLESSADLRWNICVEAEEMVTGNVGNTVFFIMCPTSLEG